MLWQFFLHWVWYPAPGTTQYRTHRNPQRLFPVALLPVNVITTFKLLMTTSSARCRSLLLQEHNSTKTRGGHNSFDLSGTVTITGDGSDDMSGALWVQVCAGRWTVQQSAQVDWLVTELSLAAFNSLVQAPDVFLWGQEGGRRSLLLILLLLLHSFT